MQGYNYARSDPFQQPQQSHKPVYLSPSYDLTSNGSAHYPHNTSTITTPTWSEAANPPAPAPVDGPEDHASSYHLTPATPTTSPYQTEQSHQLINVSTSTDPTVRKVNQPPLLQQRQRTRHPTAPGNTEPDSVRSTASERPRNNPSGKPPPPSSRTTLAPSVASVTNGRTISNPISSGYFWNELLVYKRRVRSARERDQARKGAGHGGGKRAGVEEGDETPSGRGGGGGGKRTGVEEGDETPRGEGGGGGGKRARVAGGGLRFGEALSVALGYEDLLSLAERVHRSCFFDA
ncbi:hypothetical protein HO173_007849 [Letharia columbiana]|uniref:Uncharacterized protein n=1 Tax=Letharia columbiana TaxID=112416 RepID=A0A8H6FSM7_9LECA|nr:uncharacterized protein HO173_007849 [Letharia columbiana]KAF6234019.1 hypothetical protein HO173_007849 [Letharia columbiana]